jgi:hypothetical protein
MALRTLSNLLPTESLDVFIPLIREHFPDPSGMGFSTEADDRKEDAFTALIDQVVNVISGKKTWPLMVGKQVCLHFYSIFFR